MKKEGKVFKGSFWMAIVFYGLIAFEFFYMASPFAVYFYSVYQPSLEFIDSIPFVSWMSGFFLPHIAEDTSSVLINNLIPIGLVITLIGLLCFVITASQVYYAKLFKKGAVTRGLYSVVRHPQYLSFMICSFGLLILWPRYLSLFGFITMAFGYYFLAKIEEKECLNKFGSEYEDYLKSKNMFLPMKQRKAKDYKALNWNISLKVFVLYLVSLLIGFQISDFAKEYSIDSLHTYQNENIIVVSIFESSSKDIKEVFNIVEPVLNLDRNENYIAYLLPTEMEISEIPMKRDDSAQCHVDITQIKSKDVKVILCKSDYVEKLENPLEYLFYTKKLNPIMEIRINSKAKSIEKEITLTNDDKKYYGLVEPIF